MFKYAYYMQHHLYADAYRKSYSAGGGEEKSGDGTTVTVGNPVGATSFSS